MPAALEADVEESWRRSCFPGDWVQPSRRLGVRRGFQSGGAALRSALEVGDEGGRGVPSGDQPLLGLVQPWPSDHSGLWTEEFELLITGRKAAATLLPAIRVTCTGSCKVSNKANDTAWVVEEGYFNSALSLADKAPTSFEGPFGKIVHQVRATIDTPRFSKDHQCSRKFSYKLVKTGSVVLTASTDLRGYVVGQVLRLQADIENQSGKDTSPVVASLLQGAGVKAWRRAQWQEQILVPALPQSALPGCSLIHVDYYLQVVGIQGWGGRRGRWPGSSLAQPPQVSLKTPEAIVTLPVFIGNIAVNHVPLSPQPGQGLVVPSAPPQEEAEAVAEGSGGPVPTTSTLILPPEYSSWGYPYEAPPSYEQSCGGVDPGLTPGS
ncbi:hypothetical protein E2I00_003335 [Balaenoptera physalus]|uniref:Arrestin C-terminal-like domain-containing protein n=1 Tax=Balaenoptera physalus TaxID=9770 RepID=A0A643BSK1_BALPH|nr:hypothetical protein E2I00_003335 [Balaenoptera physalus]